jgi:hypothetical protein
VNLAASIHSLDLLTEVFGPDLDTAIVKSNDDKDGAKCQAALSKNYEKLSTAALKLFGTCKNSGLKTETIVNRETLGDCMDAITSDVKTRMSKAREKLASDVNKNCAAEQLDSFFPGDCVGDPDLPNCVARLVSCRVCLMLNEQDDIAVDCDLFDDATSNLTCGP